MTAEPMTVDGATVWARHFTVGVTGASDAFRKCT